MRRELVAGDQRLGTCTLGNRRQFRVKAWVRCGGVLVAASAAIGSALPQEDVVLNCAQVSPTQGSSFAECILENRSDVTMLLIVAEGTVVPHWLLPVEVIDLNVLQTSDLRDPGLQGALRGLACYWGCLAAEAVRTAVELVPASKTIVRVNVSAAMQTEIVKSGARVAHVKLLVARRDEISNILRAHHVEPDAYRWNRPDYSIPLGIQFGSPRVKNYQACSGLDDRLDNQIQLVYSPVFALQEWHQNSPTAPTVP